MHRRLSLLLVLVVMGVGLSACGRASQTQIDAALGITPTATFSAEDLANATVAAEAKAVAQTARAGQPATPGALAEVDLPPGDVAKGKADFNTQCLRCHSVAGSPRGKSVEEIAAWTEEKSDAEFVDLIRIGTGHPKPPGPLSVTLLADSKVANILAYLRSQ